jgi:MFS family permease
MRSNVVVFLQGICAASAWAAGLFFLRFWYESRDRLFAFFGIAFWMMATSWALLGLISPTEERRPYIYGLRLVAFLLIIAAMVDKNRARDR